MLSSLTTRPMEFKSPLSAVTYLNNTAIQRHVLSIDHLAISPEGLINYTGSMPIEGFKDLPVSDFAFRQINDLAKINSAWERNTDPTLHAHSINEQFKRQKFGVTVVIESLKSDPKQRHISAILVGDRSGIDNRKILQYLVMREIDASVVLDNGSLDVRFSDSLTVEALSEDYIQVMGFINNQQWGAKSRSQPTLETGLYTLRLVCTNGAYASRKIAQGSAMASTSTQNVERLLESYINRVLAFKEGSLKQAAKAMTNSIPDDRDRERIISAIEKALPATEAAKLIAPATSSYEFWNAITAAANLVDNQAKRRQLQIQGGAFLDRFLN